MYLENQLKQIFAQAVKKTHQWCFKIAAIFTFCFFILLCFCVDFFCAGFNRLQLPFSSAAAKLICSKLVCPKLLPLQPIMTSQTLRTTWTLLSGISCTTATLTSQLCTVPFSHQFVFIFNKMAEARPGELPFFFRFLFIFKHKFLCYRYISFFSSQSYSLI